MCFVQFHLMKTKVNYTELRSKKKKVLIKCGKEVSESLRPNKWRVTTKPNCTTNYENQRKYVASDDPKSSVTSLEK